MFKMTKQYCLHFLSVAVFNREKCVSPARNESFRLRNFAVFAQARNKSGSAGHHLSLISTCADFAILLDSEDNWNSFLSDVDFFEMSV